MNIFDLLKKIQTEKTSSPAEAVPFTHILCGLGNPGPKYAKTRHNAGFMCLDYISEKLGVSVNRLKFNSLCGEAAIEGRRTLLLKPQTFMNNSGEAVREAAAFYKIPFENIIVIFDDINLSPGVMRVKRKGSDGGHNGIKSIIYHLGSENFPRIKIGVGAPGEGWDLADWVLGAIPPADREPIYKCIQSSLPGASLIIKGDIDQAMATYN